MKTCIECKGRMVERAGKTPEGVGYGYFKCNKCGWAIVDTKQLHHVAEKYRLLVHKR